MKLKFIASTRDVVIFIIFALFLLYVVALGVLNIPQLATSGTFYGLVPFEAFSLKYLHYTILFYIIALGGLIFSVHSYFFEFGEGIGIKIGDKSGGGYSDWAKTKDIKNDTDVKMVLATAMKSDYAGVPLISNGRELWVDNGEYHTLVIGATGSGKTQDTILPTIKILAKKGESVVVTDPKGEIYEKAGGMLKKRGYNIIVLNFRNPQNGNSWNPLELPYRLYKSGNQDKAIELLDDLALNILYDETNANSDPFWEKTAADYFSGIALAMFEDTTEDKININSINMTATVGEEKIGGSTYIKEYFGMKDPASAAYVNASGTVMAPSDTKGGIISVFKQKVKLFASRENLSEMLSYSDFKLDSIGKQPTAVFIIIHDEKKTYHSLATILIKQIYETLIDVAQENGGKLPIRTNFLLDEFANMPPLKDVTTMITAARSRQIRFTMIIQNFAQLNKVYGKDDAETIKGNCGNIIYLISKELAALEEISKLCGEKKSKKDDKTASTPLVTVSDLQVMKQFDHILLRMRKRPFKTSFTPDFKTNWGAAGANTKIDYPVREKRPVEVFDIRELVKAKVEEKKNKKINEMMAKIDGANPMAGGAIPPNIGGPRPQPYPSVRPKSDDDNVSEILKELDEQFSNLEKAERKAKEEKSSKPVYNNVTINNFENNQKAPNKPKDDIEILGDDFLIDNAEIERKVNEKLSNSAIESQKENVAEIKVQQEEPKPKEIKQNKIPSQDEDIELLNFFDNDEDEEVLNMIENGVPELKESPKNENVQKPEEKVGNFKPTPTIKLDDVAEDDKFFDDFFDD